jgi:hypothetical protein
MARRTSEDEWLQNIATMNTKFVGGCRHLENNATGRRTVHVSVTRIDEQFMNVFRR